MIKRCNGCTVEFWEYISNLIPYFIRMQLLFHSVIQVIYVIKWAEDTSNVLIVNDIAYGVRTFARFSTMFMIMHLPFSLWNICHASDFLGKLDIIQPIRYFPDCYDRGPHELSYEYSYGFHTMWYNLLLVSAYITSQFLYSRCIVYVVFRI